MALTYIGMHADTEPSDTLSDQNIWKHTYRVLETIVCTLPGPGSLI